MLRTCWATKLERHRRKVLHKVAAGYATCVTSYVGCGYTDGYTDGMGVTSNGVAVTRGAERGE